MSNVCTKLISEAIETCTRANVGKVTVELLKMSTLSALDVLIENGRAFETAEARTRILHLLNDYLHNLNAAAIKTVEDNGYLLVTLFQLACQAGVSPPRLVGLTGIWRKHNILSEDLLKTLPMNENVEYSVEKMLARRRVLKTGGQTEGQMGYEHAFNNKIEFKNEISNENFNNSPLRDNRQLDLELKEFSNHLKWNGLEFHELDQQQREPFTYDGWTHEFVKSYPQLDSLRETDPKHVILSTRKGYHAVPPPDDY